jgi:hypothetical protein
LDRQRETLAALDEAIENARAMSKAGKGKDGHGALQWSKQLLNLIEQRDSTLTNIKCHLLGRDETGTPTEPADYYDGNGNVMYERDFKTFLAPWTHEDLKLTCVDCGKDSEDVFTRRFPAAEYYEDDEFFDLCTKCYTKRKKQQPVKKEESEEADDSESDEEEEEEEDSEASDPASILKELDETQGGGNAGALTGGVRNIITLVRSDNRPPAEKVKTLEEFKASVCQSAKNSHSEHALAPGLALLDKEIERLKKEAEAGKGGAGKPVE